MIRLSGDEPPAGRELDALIAEKVMGWKKVELTSDMNLPWAIKELGITWMWDKKEACYWNQAQVTPNYSTSISDAWEVVEKLKADGWNIAITNCDRYAVWIDKDWIDDLVGLSDVRANTAPHAICLAALKAVGAM